jgi:hypothetical protein
MALNFEIDIGRFSALDQIEEIEVVHRGAHWRLPQELWGVLSEDLSEGDPLRAAAIVRRKSAGLCRRSCEPLLSRRRL